ncbi:sulfatase [Botrimarina sp.]|uniref:sulfatase n=1 Tax=Botrimarina sp. TaxID=2795802 RepID=UPI0032EF2135
MTKLLATLLLLAAPGYAAAAADTATPSNRLNVLFIAIDDLRPELGCYGADHVVSPNLDRLAVEGVRFNNAYCQFPVCGPSRASLLSGLYATSSRFLDNNVLVQREAAGCRTLPGAFKKAGYHTVSNGKIFHAADDTVGSSWSEPPFNLVTSPRDNNHATPHDPESKQYVGGLKQRGPFFESPDVPDGTYIDGQVCEKTIDDLKRLAGGEAPFFLACGFVRPHLPFYAPQRYWDLYPASRIDIAQNRSAPVNAPRELRSGSEIRTYHDRGVEYNSDEFHRVARRGYYACVSYVDALVGRLMDTLDDLGIRDRTVVVLWGDHGWQLGEHDFWGKHTLLRNSLRSPLIVSAPGYTPDAEVDGIVELIDLYPTLCELTGVPAPGHLQGKSFVPLMADPTLPGKAAAYMRNTRGAAIVTPESLYAEYDSGAEMLFDHRNDLDEDVNVVSQPERAETVSRMRALMAQIEALAEGSAE